MTVIDNTSVYEERAKALAEIFAHDNKKYGDINLATIISAFINSGIVAKDFQGEVLIRKNFFKVNV